MTRFDGPLFNLIVGFFFIFPTFNGGTLSIKSTSFAKSAAILAGPDLIGLKRTFSN